ncbi:hypothetical protein F4780DRAFT_770941 [Xylariomycetidae sp. FL0641]|nr:hypothetical protein F4780DRAFT_770941 [Xylariomycetidae sp. FL0641]
MASQASVASSQPDPRHLRLIAASAQANEVRVRDILTEDPPWTSSSDHDALRQALQKVAARGKLSVVRLLLEHGAEVNGKRESEVPALAKAAEAGHVQVVTELLAWHADPNGRSRHGQTALFSAALRGHDKVVDALLAGGANVNARDKEGRSPLLFIAAEKHGKVRWTPNTLQLLLSKGADVEVRDQIDRTPLLWAATNANVTLARILLENGVDVSATNNRGRTALHLAAESNDKEHREEMVKLLLQYGADPNATSDGGWTPLHNAAQSGHLPIVALLLDAGAYANAELFNGMTPLHWAAFNGFEDIVKVLLTRPDTDLTIKDSFERTPMLCAAEKNHPEIVHLLSPARAASRLSPLEEAACKAFEATIVDFGNFEKRQLNTKYSVYDLLYGWDHENDKPTVSTLTKNIKYKPEFRWIHLPANNIAWAETLLSKWFIESGHRDIDSFKALEKCFDQEHRGNFAHAHFMRTFCQRISSVRNDMSEGREEKLLMPLSEEKPGGKQQQQAENVEPGTPKPENKKKSKSEQLTERHPKKHKRGKGPPGLPPYRQNSGMSGSGSKVSLSLPPGASKYSSNGKIVLFMPFLHYETDERRRKMSSAIEKSHRGQLLVDKASRDSLLINAYMASRVLHPRRTLDQFLYHGIDTSARDTDQVVYRYCKTHKIETKVFMVDQLWLWIIDKDLVITCFPQRWDQPKHDPLNVLSGIIEEINAKTRSPIQSVHDLAFLITSRCSGMFDRHRLDNQDYQFLDMFENSIGVVTDRESRLFSRFNRASAQSAKWLQNHKQRRRMGRRRAHEESESDEESDADPNHPYYHSQTRSHSRRGHDDTDSSSDDEDGSDGLRTVDQFPDALLDIGVETSLLAEIKDIGDELQIINVILDAQLTTVGDLEAAVADEIRSLADAPRRAVEPTIAELRRRAREQRRGLEVRQRDVERMDEQARSLHDSLLALLDLKQKHSNALEARFAGDQAVIAARQGQTVMVFTLVTIVFLPMSFIAAFFAINLDDWERRGGLSLAYVSKFLFGLGLAISAVFIALAFAVAEIEDAVRAAWRWVRRRGGGGGGKKKKQQNGGDKGGRRRRRRKGAKDGGQGRRRRGGGHGHADAGVDGEKSTTTRHHHTTLLPPPKHASSSPAASTSVFHRAATAAPPPTSSSSGARLGTRSPPQQHGHFPHLRDRGGGGGGGGRAYRGLGRGSGGAGWARPSLEAGGRGDLEWGGGGGMR